MREDEYTHPTTMYGCNKLYCEQLGRYYARHYKQLSADVARRVDFRAVRFPGLISALTTPVGRHLRLRAGDDPCGGARGTLYDCFVRPDTTIPFMVMPDGVDALLALAAAPREALTRTEYNLRAFNPSAAEIRDVVRAGMPRGVDHVQSGRQASGDSRYLAGGCRRFRGPRRTGASIRCTISSERSASTWCPPSAPGIAGSRCPQPSVDQWRDRRFAPGNRLQRRVRV